MVRDPSLPSPTTISFNTALVASGSADGNWQHSLCMLSSMVTQKQLELYVLFAVYEYQMVDSCVLRVKHV